MVSYAKENQTQQQTDKDVVCPKCFKPLQGQSVLHAIPDRYGRKLRKYFGWCLECNRGFEVVQFDKDNRWHIHKYQNYEVIGQKIHCTPAGNWTTVNELPEPAPVVVGPGGDYDKSFDLETVELMKTVLNALKATTKTVELLLKSSKVK